LVQKRASPTYKRRYRTLAAHIGNFEVKTGLKLRTDNLNEAMCEEFLRYLRTSARLKDKSKGDGLNLFSAI
jgi:hypothetical protein